MLKKLLHEEKSHRHAMYTTMRNLMKAFEKENTGIEGMISHRIETLFLPAIERLKKEPSPEIRNMYLDILRGATARPHQRIQPVSGRPVLIPDSNGTQGVQLDQAGLFHQGNRP
jgi:hypothetical protein